MTLEMNPLYMHKFFFDTQKLTMFFKERQLTQSSGSADFGYGIHSILKELFGTMALQPFHLLRCFSNSCEILGYCQHDLGTLHNHADSFADPTLHQLVNWDVCSTKKMPNNFSTGMRLSFEVRVCPVKRSRNTNLLNSKPQGIVREYDAYLSRQDSSLSRDQVYGEWLRRILEHAGVNVIQTRMERFLQVKTLQRRDNQRSLKSLGQRPDVTLIGLIEVSDSIAFRRMLALGIGRHKAFGFGMMLLKPTIN
jgi:CRISPR system Cascade subunit CasE